MILYRKLRNFDLRRKNYGTKPKKNYKTSIYCRQKYGIIQEQSMFLNKFDQRTEMYYKRKNYSTLEKI